MSLDGAYLHLIKQELLNGGLVGSRIDKITQPSREEIIIAFRAEGEMKRVLLSANPSSARIGFTSRAAESPKSPPMLCMLLRKHLGGGRLLDITQDGLERIIIFRFQCMNEIGDMVTNRLICEVMGRFSNIILASETDNGIRVIDSVKRVTDEISSVRRILPGIMYEAPPREKRLSLLDFDREEVVAALTSNPADRLYKALIAHFEGISPIFARECACYVGRDVDFPAGGLTGDRIDRLFFFLNKAASALTVDGNATFTIVSDGNGAMKDFCFLPVRQYGSAMNTSEEPSASALLDKFYGGKADSDRLRQRSGDLLKLLMNTYERISRKIEAQRIELAACAERDKLRVTGDLINASLYKLTKGISEAELLNFYTGESEKVSLDPRLTPSQNAQKYYSEYKKLDTAEKMLTELISSGEKELIYIDSVFDAVSRASGENEISEIKEELAQTGYIHRGKGVYARDKRQRKLPPMKFISSDGYEIIAGKNNTQNDQLSLKTAKTGDIWLHTHDLAGSHVIIFTKGKTLNELPDKTLLEAAAIAATNSKGASGTKIPVDYCDARYVKKPTGAKPGMVIFTNNYTVLVDPDKELTERLAVK